MWFTDAGATGCGWCTPNASCLDATCICNNGFTDNGTFCIGSKRALYFQMSFSLFNFLHPALLNTFMLVLCYPFKSITIGNLLDTVKYVRVLVRSNGLVPNVRSLILTSHQNLKQIFLIQSSTYYYRLNQ